MRPLLPSLLIALAIGTPLNATEVEPVEPARILAEPALITAPEVAAAPAMRLDEIRVEERTAVADADAAQLPARGSFWWLVGVIVVAGVILAVLL